jgi:hypothetical protein
MFSTGHTIWNSVLAGLAVQIIGCHWVVAERTGCFFHLCLSGDRASRNLFDSGFVFLGYLLSVLRTHEHAGPVVSDFFQVCLRGLDHSGGQDVHRVLGKLGYVLADSVQKPRGGFVVALLYYPFYFFNTFSLCCMNEESLVYLIFLREFLCYSFSYL